MLRLVANEDFIYLVTAPKKYKFFSCINFNLEYPEYKSLPVQDYMFLVFKTNSQLECEELIGEARKHGLYVRTLHESSENQRYQEYYQDPGYPPIVRPYIFGNRLEIELTKDQVQNYKNWIRDLKDNLGYHGIWYKKVKNLKYHYIVK